MFLFDFFKRKEKILTDEDIEEEYQKSWRRVQSARAKSASLIRAIEALAEKRCTPQTGDDLLAKKEEFIRYRSFVARNDQYHYSLKYKGGKFKSYPLWTQKWHDQEQAERLKAQKSWRILMQNCKTR